MNKKDIIDGFNAVTTEMAYVHQEKIEEYGISRYREAGETETPIMLFSDIHRKYIRLREQLLTRRLGGQEPDWASVRRGCVDLANYGVMGVQLADLIQSNGRQPENWERLRPKPSPEPVPPPPATFPLEQIALVGRTGTVDMLKMLGATEWHLDTVTTRGIVYWESDKVIEQQALLAFNYQLIPGKELEVIRYIRGDNFLSSSGTLGGMSHLGLHVDDIDRATQILRDCMGDVSIAQDAVTIRHTNPHIKDTRRYRYRIFDTRNELGFFLKFIQRHMVVEGFKYIQWPEPFGRVDLEQFR